MKAVGLHPDVLVVTSRFWQTTCTLVRSRRGGLLRRLAGAARTSSSCCPRSPQQAGFRVVGRLATHADWDHLLGGYAFPDAPLGGGRDERRAAAQRAGRRPARAARVRRRALRRAARPAVAADAAGAAGARPLRDRRAGARAASRRRPHRRRHGDPRSPGRRVLVCGDYLSPVEIPWISEGGSASRLPGDARPARAAVERVEHVVPGHGGASTPSARWRSCARTAPTCRRCSSRARTRRCRSRAARARSARSTPRTSPRIALAAASAPRRRARRGAGTSHRERRGRARAALRVDAPERHAVAAGRVHAAMYSAVDGCTAARWRTCSRWTEMNARTAPAPRLQRIDEPAVLVDARA